MISEETRSKMKENRYLRKLVFGYLNSPETREKLRKANLGKKLSEETKEKIRLFRKGRKLSKETREKMRLSRLGPKNHFYGKHHSEETKEKLRIANLGKIPVNVFKKGNVPVNKGRCIDEMYSSERADEIKKKMSLAKLGKSASPIWLKSMEGKFRKGENHPMYGKHHTEESKLKISLCNKGKHPVKEFRKGQIPWNKGLTKETDSRVKIPFTAFKRGLIPWNKGLKYKNPEHSKFMKEMFKNDSYKKKIIELTLKSLFKRPTSFEQRIILLCSKYRLPFVYTGDGRLLIGYKNPDFVNEKDKIVIEVFLNYFKIKSFGSVENYIKKRSEHFDKYGYKVIFIKEEDILNNNWENICLSKIVEGMGGEGI